MKPSNPGVLVGVVVVFAVVTWAFLQGAYASLPQVPWTAIPTFLLLAIGEAYTGWLTRGRIMRKEDTTPPEPLVVARLAALAKATALAGAAFAGMFGGFLIHTLGMFDIPGPRHDALVSAGSLISAVVLVCAALFLEFCCRIPGDKNNQDQRPA
ncbi:DUF3180 domain-containing protein [Herbidospora yilanensis]|uniref:DUF3180 domain-containing protein n=1 Tax=Herbidospora yilanensis TaxID=354426 RepID=UPI000781196D|nr:DUF3180 domain-containing protein [Herbidospora yilanensis]